ncbi:hypothetical protein LSUB1_G005944 [Lachnellula subtilissima]|uniref:Rhodopsin domain-containing protein n=1 Tax=Lachnellula subtilissima TaxID=602034 RepID=A0A8H8UAZ0_9HELO|nr:hypothetical protein LSUB1_G005944 [Lachnellula subtilissima]
MANNNSTACYITGNCTILDGSQTNGTFYVFGSNGYDPNAPVPLWHQRLELATICTADSLTIILIAARILYRWHRLKRLRADDRWMIAAGFFVTAYLLSQIFTNKNGSGLHIQNVKKPWLEGHWKWQVGWSAYYAANSSIKISVCFCFIEILPIHFKKMRLCVYALAVLIALLGVTMGVAWVFQCSPFLSNFRWSVEPVVCVNWDIFRWVWIGLSLPIDFLLMLIPLLILKRSNIQGLERRILKWCFLATFLGTIVCACGIYGAYETRTAEVFDAYYQETPFIMMNNIELFMYALGASLPVLSRYLVARAGPETRQTHSNFSSWARNVPNFFSTAARDSHGTVATFRQHSQPQALSTINSIQSTTEGANTPDLQLQKHHNTHELEQPAMSELEKGQTPSVDTQYCMSPASDDGLLVRHKSRSIDQ